MDIKKYQVLLHALRCSSFSQTAQELDYTQSGISHMMKSLEEQFGFPVLVRHRNGLRLTKNGEEVIPYIRQLVQASDSLLEQVALLKGVREGTVTIGASSSASVRLLFPVLRAFHLDYSHIEFQIVDGTTEKLGKLLAESKLDIAFGGEIDNPSLDKVPVLRDEPLFAIVPATDPLAGLASFPYEAFTCHHFIVPSSDGSCETAEFMRSANLEVECPYFVSDSYAAISMVEQGMGYSVLPESALDVFPNTVARIPLNPPRSRSIFMYTPANSILPPAVKLFVDYCSRYIPGMQAADLLEQSAMQAGTDISESLAAES